MILPRARIALPERRLKFAVDWRSRCGSAVFAASAIRSMAWTVLIYPVADKLRGLPLMLDFLMIAYPIGFFVLATLYVVACEKM